MTAFTVIFPADFISLYVIYHNKTSYHHYHLKQLWT